MHIDTYKIKSVVFREKTLNILKLLVTKTFGDKLATQEANKPASTVASLASVLVSNHVTLNHANIEK